MFRPQLALSASPGGGSDLSDARHFRGAKRGAAETGCGYLIPVDICDTYRLDPSGARALAADPIAAANEVCEHHEGRR